MYYQFYETGIQVGTVALYSVWYSDAGYGLDDGIIFVDKLVGTWDREECDWIIKSIYTWKLV